MLRIAVLLASGMMLAACQPLEPSGEKQKPLPEKPVVALSFASENMAEISVGSQIALGAYPVIDEEVSDAAEAEQALVIEEDQALEAELELNAAGAKELVAVLSDQDGLEMGAGRLRIEVEPGFNLIEEELEIVLKPIGDRSTSVRLRIKIVVLPKGGETPVSFLEIKPLLKKYECVPCHNRDEIGDFTKFPFTHEDPDMNFEQLVFESIMQMEDGLMPLGRDNQVPEDVILLFDDWLNEGMIEAPEGSPEDLKIIKKVKLAHKLNGETIEIEAEEVAPGEYVTTVEELPLGQEINVCWSVMGESDEELANTGWTPVKVRDSMQVREQVLIRRDVE